MNIYKREDIESKYTEIISRYIRNGYVIYPESMSGSQGEIAKIDLTDGKEIVRVYIESKSHYGSKEDNWFSYESIDITTEVHPFEAQAGLFSTIWTGKGREIERLEYCRLRGRYSGSLNGSYTTKDEYVRMCKDSEQKRIERRQNNREDDDVITSKKVYDKLLEIVKAQRGCKTVTMKDILGARKIDGKYVVYLSPLRRQNGVSIDWNGVRVW